MRHQHFIHFNQQDPNYPRSPSLSFTMKISLVFALGALVQTVTPRPAYQKGLRVENFISSGLSLDMVSSLIIGSESAVIIDLPLTIPQAQALAKWVVNTTDKPLVAAFSTHSHPDHYLGSTAFLAQFPETKYYASSKVVSLIKQEAAAKVCRSTKCIDLENLLTTTTAGNILERRTWRRNHSRKSHYPYSLRLLILYVAR
jgi:hypothetical protein